MIRILHVFGNVAAMQHWIAHEVFGTRKEVIAPTRRETAVVELWNGNEMTRFDCVVMRHHEDAERYRGRRYDALMAHDSFRREGHEKVWQLLDFLRSMVLKP